MKSEAFNEMKLLSLISVELLKIRRSRIFWILLIPAVMMWFPSAMNANVNFVMNSYEISPEYNYFIQGYMGMAWFMIPATLIICGVLLNQTERTNRGLLKCLSLPVNPSKICLAKFLVMVTLLFEQLFLSIAACYGSAAIASKLYDYDFILPFPYVCRAASLIYLAALPMAAAYWMISILIHTPIFSVGLGLASVVPSVLMLNTGIWYCYPMDYPFYVLMTEYGKIAPEVFDTGIQLFPLLPIAVGVTLLCLAISCLRYGKSERR
ncbi:ABC transporter permease [Acetatifactor muris]|uniref:ABC-2 family transporter protein n=1 Tax=Acetatifactor muris TaxID=879566 RepID=A0A2K4ZJ05_9FIRM|nr:ABC transporter permease [Acetatifactor muris]MCR2045942.1 ABC transporter permease [Acetatifactor muris]SOY30431.1 ABC-2 family transporter protein [Acetatifactor muris]